MKKYIIKVNGVAYDVEVEEAGGGDVALQGHEHGAAHNLGHSAPKAQPPVGNAPQQGLGHGEQQGLGRAQLPPATPVEREAPHSLERGAAQQKSAQHTPPQGSKPVTSPMPGTVTKILVKAGDQVMRTQPVVILEAMKMENEIVSPYDGRISTVHVAQGAAVNTGEALVSVK